MKNDHSKYIEELDRDIQSLYTEFDIEMERLDKLNKLDKPTNEQIIQKRGLTRLVNLLRDHKDLKLQVKQMVTADQFREAGIYYDRYGELVNTYGLDTTRKFKIGEVLESTFENHFELMKGLDEGHVTIEDYIEQMNLMTGTPSESILFAIKVSEDIVINELDSKSNKDYNVFMTCYHKMANVALRLNL